MADEKKFSNAKVSQFDPQLKARELVLEQYNQFFAGKNDKLTLDDVYVVWFCKTLQNWKVLISTTADDGRYYEVTHSGSREKTFVDIYKKTHNIEHVEQI